MDELTVQPDVAFEGHPEHNLTDSPPVQLHVTDLPPQAEAVTVEAPPAAVPADAAPGWNSTAATSLT